MRLKARRLVGELIYWLLVILLSPLLLAGLILWATYKWENHCAGKVDGSNHVDGGGGHGGLDGKRMAVGRRSR